jgi:hypothetical protein
MGWRRGSRNSGLRSLRRIDHWRGGGRGEPWPFWVCACACVYVKGFKKGYVTIVLLLFSVIHSGVRARSRWTFVTKKVCHILFVLYNARGTREDGTQTYIPGAVLQIVLRLAIFSFLHGMYLSSRIFLNPSW